MFHRPDKVNQPLYVITPVFNPQRYRTRWKLYKEFENYILSNKQAHLITIECTFGEREESLVEQSSEFHTVIHVRTKHESWIKENLINRAIQELPEDWKYVAWIDADITFARPDWVGETIQQLQHYDVVQMFAHAADLGPNNEIVREYTGFMYCYKNQSTVVPFDKKAYITPGKNGEPTKGYWHPGFAWACTRGAIDNLGGLIDWGVLGGGDTFMAYGLTGLLNQRTMPRSLGKNGVRMLEIWSDRAEKFVKRNVGYIEGTILHYWHGSRKSRGYLDRGQILTSAKFDPELDMKRDWQGIYQLTDRSIALRDNIRAYFRKRNEDSIDL